MKDHLDPVATVVEQLTPADGAHDWVRGIVDDVVRCDWRKTRSTLSKDATFEPNNIVLR